MELTRQLISKITMVCLVRGLEVSGKKLKAKIEVRSVQSTPSINTERATSIFLFIELPVRGCGQRSS